jgi:hypothetical protein
MKKITLGFLLLLILVLPWSTLFSGETEMPIVQPPMVVTTMGQSPGALMFRLVCTRSQIADLRSRLQNMRTLSKTDWDSTSKILLKQIRKWYISSRVSFRNEEVHTHLPAYALS